MGFVGRWRHRDGPNVIFHPAKSDDQLGFHGPYGRGALQPGARGVAGTERGHRAPCYLVARGHACWDEVAVAGPEACQEMQRLRGLRLRLRLRGQGGRAMGRGWGPTRPQGSNRR
jgi:hypothetical protein